MLFVRHFLGSPLLSLDVPGHRGAVMALFVLPDAIPFPRVARSAQCLQIVRGSLSALGHGNGVVALKFILVAAFQAGPAIPLKDLSAEFRGNLSAPIGSIPGCTESAYRPIAIRRPNQVAINFDLPNCHNKGVAG